MHSVLLISPGITVKDNMFRTDRYIPYLVNGETLKAKITPEVRINDGLDCVSYVSVE